MTALMVEDTKPAAPWFVVITHVNQEKLAKYQLERQGHAVYMPMVPPSPRARMRNGVPPSVRPMIPRYLFVQVDLDQPGWPAIYSTFGVSEVISSGTGEGRRPRAIPTRFIEEIRAREVNGLVILPEARKAGPAPVACRFKKGDKLRWHGPTADYEVVFQQMVDGNRAEVVFTLMGVDSRQVISLPSDD
ncbi:transcription termination/antitermination NusG family protein [Brevundimonas subvibrioides]|uniref:NGN domain protein n=1 Tax=Brevundimonas subvibrioides (strain ATCC 15264 / DSM 4735 / LMG 14903 / NBRC 16000 / CB 81) TaxID=633149 RepID=D9QFX3_BRESC|nr:transcription termination/antitermination NusG family protein [Brevundimonas subvibrioides]ADL00687.1 NGN domain protein [Brevundimonas subvibrioides ATCC 15264]